MFRLHGTEQPGDDQHQVILGFHVEEQADIFHRFRFRAGSIPAPGIMI